MNRSMIAAAALVAGIAIAAPTLVWSAPQSTQDAPTRPGMGDMAGMHGMMGGMHEHDDATGHHGWMHEGKRHRLTRLSPQQRCEEHLARRAGMIAYTIAKVNPTPEQRPSWDKLHGLLQQAADRERQLCASLKPEAERRQQTILDRLNRRQQFLTARLEGLQQVRPALEQFYQALTAEQKAIMDHPFRTP